VSLRSSDGAILLGTSAGQIYAIDQSGRLRWKHTTPTSVWSGLYALNEQAVTFLGLDWRLYALRNSGAALYRVRAPSTPTTEPVVARRDVVWVGLSGAVARFVAALRLERLALDPAGISRAPVEQIVTVGDYAVARASGHAYFLASGQDAIDLGPAQQLGSDGQKVAIVVGHELHLIDVAPTTGAKGARVTPRKLAQFELSAGREVSGELTVRDAVVLVPNDSGSVSVYQSGEQRCEAQVSEVALRRPILGRSGRYFLVTDHGGQFCAVSLAEDMAEIRSGGSLHGHANRTP